MTEEISGVWGETSGVTALEAPLAGDIPIELTQVMVKVYCWLLLSPFTSILDPLLFPIIPPGVDVAVYSMIVAPPFHPGVNVTTADCDLAVAMTAVGAAGKVAPVTGFEG